MSSSWDRYQYDAKNMPPPWNEYQNGTCHLHKMGVKLMQSTHHLHGMGFKTITRDSWFEDSPNNHDVSNNNHIIPQSNPLSTTSYATKEHQPHSSPNHHPPHRSHPTILHLSLQFTKRSTAIKIIWNWKNGKVDMETKKRANPTGKRRLHWVHNTQLVSNSVSLMRKESVLFLSKCLKKSSDISGEPLELIVFFNLVGASTLFNS